MFFVFVFFSKMALTATGVKKKKKRGGGVNGLKELQRFVASTSACLMKVRVNKRSDAMMEQV